MLHACSPYTQSCHVAYTRIYSYNSVELNLSVPKLLPQLKYDRHEKWNTCEVPHGECHGGVNGGISSLLEKITACYSLCACAKNVLFLYVCTECVCGVLETTRSLPAAWANDSLMLLLIILN